MQEAYNAAASALRYRGGGSGFARSMLATVPRHLPKMCELSGRILSCSASARACTVHAALLPLLVSQ